MKAISLWQAYLAGALHGDAWCTNSSFGLRVKDRDFADAFVLALNSVTGTQISVLQDERGYWTVRASNATGRFSSLRKYLPHDDDERSAWLRGMFDSGGNAQLWHMPHVSPNSHHRRVAFYSTSTETLRIVGEHLRSLTIPFTIRSTSNSISHKGSKTVFELRVVRKEGFTKFARLVGSSIGRKNDRLQAIIAAYDKSEGFSSRGGILGSAARRARRSAGGAY